MSVGLRVAVIAMIAVIAARAVHLRAQVVRDGYQMRSMLEDRARLRNELAWLEARVATLERPERLLSEARRFQLEVGRLHAGVRVIPTLRRGDVE